MKILLVRLSSMGDLIHTLPAVTDLAQHCPDLQLHWLCEHGFADIARLHPFVEQVHSMAWRSWRKQLFQAATWQQMRQLKQNLTAQKFDVVLDSQGLLKSAVFAKLANAPIWGLDYHSAREPLASKFYAQTFSVKKGEDAVWRNRQLFAQAFNYKVTDAPNFGVCVPVDCFDGALPPVYYVALHATSRKSKLWSVENWLALLGQIYANDAVPIFLPWGNEVEKQRAEYLAHRLPCLMVCPKLNLLQAAQLLAGAKAVVGVDTGLLHLANAVNRPLVGIYTDSDAMKTGVQVSKISMNLGGIHQSPSVQQVFDALQSCLKNQTSHK